MNLGTCLYFVEMCDSGQQVVLCRSLRDTSSRLAELGWLHNKVRKYTDARSLDRAFGLVGQVCFCVCALPLIVCFYTSNIHKMCFLLPSEFLCFIASGAERVLQVTLCPPLSGTHNIL